MFGVERHGRLECFQGLVGVADPAQLVGLQDPQ